MKNIILFSIVIIGVLVIGALIYTNPSVLSLSDTEEDNGNVLSAQDAGDRAINFINENILAGQDMTASLINVADESGLYKLSIKVGESDFDSYITKNGKLLFPEFIDLDELLAEQNKEATKKDRPDVKLFVMSYCPYGLQAQKMFIPVRNLLKDKVNFEITFVDYILHEKQEVDENLNQYCIQKQNQGKYYSYLTCFTKEGDSAGCFKEVEIDKAQFDTCITETDAQYKITENYNDKDKWIQGQFPAFNIHADLNEKYDVQGSPTIVINDQVIEVNPRSPENFKNIICESFNEKPEECSNILPGEAFSPGFGDEPGLSSGGSCQ